MVSVEAASESASPLSSPETSASRARRSQCRRLAKSCGSPVPAVRPLTATSPSGGATSFATSGGKSLSNEDISGTGVDLRSRSTETASKSQRHEAPKRARTSRRKIEWRDGGQEQRGRRWTRFDTRASGLYANG